MRLYVGAITLMLVVTAFVLADTAADEYDKLMKPAINANMKLTMSVTAGDLSAADSNADDVWVAFQDIKEYWMQRGVADAAMFAANIQQNADDISSAAKSGDKAAAASSQMKIAASCAGCHMAHRVRNADNTYSIK